MRKNQDLRRKISLQFIDIRSGDGNSYLTYIVEDTR